LSQNIELTYKVIKCLREEVEYLAREQYKFTSRSLARKIKESGDIRKINAIIKKISKEGIIKYNKKMKYYYLDVEDKDKLDMYMKELSDTLILSYDKPLNKIEPPINVYKIVNGVGKLVAQAKREGILKSIYHVNGEENYEIIFKTYKFAGFTIKKMDEIIFEAYRIGFMKPIESFYKGENIIIKRIWGREIAILNSRKEKIGCMKGLGIEKATFTCKEPLKKISIPLSIALYAIKQLDVII